MAHPTEDKNFRLPTTVRPRRYAATLTLDLEARALSGQQTVDLELAQPTREIILHAIALQVGEVTFRASGASHRPASIDVMPQSETVVLRFAEALPAGAGSLDVAWTGRFTEGLRGLYLAGKVAATQFEAADARRVFPCFDEPAFKARWALTVRVPQGNTVLSNGAVVKEEQDGALRRVTFQETEVLSSYLIALVVGPLTGTAEERAQGVPVRTWALTEKAHLTRFGQDVALNVLPRLQDYFGLPYAYGKVDQVGIPDFEAGAMENAGLITYREVTLLLDPTTAPLSVQKRVAEVVTHELAHQWFGNWVTMVWWDDLWLNEAFATWMAFKIVDQWRPDWRMWLDFDAHKASALHLDALSSTHPIRGEVRNAGEAGENFDVITYEKGGAVLRMIEGFLGENAFRDGIRQYMRKHARANAVADDLWSALGEAAKQPVVELANAWIGQSGYPLVSVSVSGRTLTLTQRRFYSEPGMRSDERWPVPVVLRFADDSGVHEQRVLLRDAQTTVTLEGSTAPVRWLCANAGATGFYRVAYDANAMKGLAANLSALAPSERIALLADQWARVRAGEASVADFLDLAGRYHGEQDDAVLDELVGRLAYVEGRLVEGEDQERFRRWVERLLGDGLKKLGWQPAAGESDRDRLRRAALVRAVGGLARSPETVAEARGRVARMLQGEKDALEPNLLDTAVSMVARAGDTALFEQLLARVPTEPDPATQRRYLMALAAFEDPALASRAQGLLFTETVKTQDSAGFISGLLANRTGRDAWWLRMQQQWKEVVGRAGGAPMLLRRVVEALGFLRTRAQLEQARALLDAQPIPEAQQATRQTLERLTQDVALRERAAPEVSAWLKRQP
ncbi:M1 family peptidase [Corallococcus sp. H22C18031201]|uniref:M1 family metallopeptidase n=1 Tax=Citreicoccus inhibens TaxID=2849499 RepID=UPI000E73473C|nr:M1 family metallopeptidase [Citreicoccus inhibens]MBU8900251.1 ERAP1-like C-terminal domain-containing protein [Citreicoccus inhibens]RJS18346.1 M1 family peptidase [Corallococcus sp. H22C18031201]